MQSIHILRDQPKLFELPLHLRHGIMGWVGSFGGDEFAPPVIPLPHEPGITLKGLWCGQVFRAKILPESVGPAECRHAAVGRNTGACEHGHRSCRGEFALNQAEG